MCPHCRNANQTGCVHCRDQRRERARIGFQQRHHRTREERLTLGLIAGPITNETPEVSKIPIKPFVKPDHKWRVPIKFGSSVLPSGFML